MILVYILSAAWSLGCIAAVIAIVAYLWGDETPIMAGVVGLIGLPFAAVLALLPWAAIDDMQSPDLVTLKKGDWACSAQHTETGSTVMSTGKTTMVLPTSHSVCDQYSRLN